MPLIDDLLTALGRHAAHQVAFFDGPQLARRSFGELREDVLRAAERLSAWGVRRRSRVGILAPNSYHWTVHDLALQHLRAISVAFPDKLDCPPEELHRHYDLDLLLVAREGAAAPTAGPRAFLDAETQPAPRLDRTGRVLTRAGENEPLSIVFSSGSSGKLKTLRVSDRGTRQLIENFCAIFTFREDDRFLIFLPLSSYQQRVMTFGCILHAVDFALLDAAQLFKGFALFQPSLCLAPPLLFETVHDNFVRGVARAPATQRLAFRLLSALAAALPPRLRRPLQRRCWRPIHELFGGRIRLFWTGMAPIRPATLAFLGAAGIPIYEANGLNECGPIACNRPGANRIGSVGLPVTPGSIEIAGDGEVIVHIDHPVTTGYEECDPSDERQVYRPQGRIATGDLGFFDADGFLHLAGRKKEVIVTRAGHKISPEVLEKRINDAPHVLQSAVFGNGLPFIVAVVVVDDGDPAVVAQIEAHIARLNQDQPAALAVQKAHFTSEKFSPQNGLLTRNFKLNRPAIFAYFKDLLLPAAAHPATAAERPKRAGQAG